MKIFRQLSVLRILSVPVKEKVSEESRLPGGLRTSFQVVEKLVPWTFVLEPQLTITQLKEELLDEVAQSNVV
jgi:hypothetical protein